MRRLVSPQPEPTLFGLPIELRREIYHWVAISSSKDLALLLRTSSQIYHDAKDILYRQTVVFGHQNELMAFALLADPNLLRFVDGITIRIHETDISKVANFLRRTAQNGSDPSIDPYQQEIGLITEALARIGPQLQRLAVLKPLSEDKTATCDVFQRFFGWAKQNYQCLESLHLGIDKLPLTFLPMFTRLKCLHFSGFSVTSEQDTLTFLRLLVHLEELKTTGPPKDHSFHQRVGFRGQPIVQSLTPSVLGQIQPLKRLSICELRDPYNDDQVLLTPTMLRTLTTTHANTLQSLSITANMPLPPSTVNEISQLLISCPLVETLELSWINMDHGPLIASLPPTTKSLSLLASPSSTSPFYPSSPSLSFSPASDTTTGSLASFVDEDPIIPPPSPPLSESIDQILQQLEHRASELSVLRCVVFYVYDEDFYEKDRGSKRNGGRLRRYVSSSGTKNEDGYGCQNAMGQGEGMGLVSKWWVWWRKWNCMPVVY